MYRLEVDFIVRFVPPMSDNGNGICVTRCIELPFPPFKGMAVHSKEWEGIDDPLGYRLKDIVWDLDRCWFLAITALSVTGTPIALIPDIRNLIECGWRYGSFRDNYQGEKRKGRPKKKPAPLKIGNWDWDDAAKWETMAERDRPKEFNLVFQSVTALLAELGNNWDVGYAMSKTHMFFNVYKDDRYADLSTDAERFRDARIEFDRMSFDQQQAWADRVRARSPKLIDIVNAME